MHGSKVWGAVVLAGLVGATSVAGWGCGSDSGNPSGGGGSASTGTSMGGGGQGGTGSGDGKIKTASLVTNQIAFDAALSDDGSIVYFTGASSKGGAGVFSVPASGGSPVVIAQGGALVAPFGIAVSTDGKTLFIADPGAETSKDDGGTIFTVNAEGGSPSALTGTTNVVPRSLDAVDEGGKQVLYFSGTVKGAPGVFKISGSGGSITAVASGASFHDPAGVAVAADGTVYVVDTIAGSRADATVIAIDKNGKVSTLFPHASVGYPAGLALVQDEKAVLLSGQRDANGYAAVLRIDTNSHEGTYFPGDGTKSDFTSLFEPGGIHRAKKTDHYAWVVADATGGGIFLLK